MRSYAAIKIIRHPSIHLGQPHVVCTSKLKKGSYFREKNKPLECGLSLCLFSLSLPHFTVFFSHICSATLLGLAHAIPACGLVMKMKEESQKAGLKHNIQQTKIMATDPITSWQIDGGTVETVSDFIILISKITGNGDCNHEI